MSLSATREIKITTDNKVLKPGEDLKIEVEIEVSVPASYEEAAEWFGGEEKLLESIQTDVARRKGNTARPVLRDAERELDWDKAALNAAENYQPGRRTAPEVIDESELEKVVSGGSLEDVTAFLAAKGYQVRLGA
jgi:hypothetical protein